MDKLMKTLALTDVTLLVRVLMADGGGALLDVVQLQPSAQGVVVNHTQVRQL